MPKDIFNLNKIGLMVAILLAIILLLYPFKIGYLLLLELALAGYGYYLYLEIKQHKNSAIIINQQDKWFVKRNGEMYPVKLKDYWILKKHMFFWVKGAKISVSFVVSRSIIGAQKFSQLRTLLK